MKFKNCTFSIVLIFIALNSTAQAQSPVEIHGQLKVSGNKILGADNNPAQLRGMSLYWSQWAGKYYNANVVKWIKDDWCASVIRAAMAVDNGGYLTNTAEKNKVFDVIDAAIANGMYVIVDWHIDYNAPAHINQAKTFFSEVATKYGSYPNIIYELWNEPLDVSWSNVIKPYHNEMVKTIRDIDPDNLIVCGTRSWSQRVDEAANDPVTGTNIAYTLHYYAASHGQSFRDLCTQALNKNVAIFVTEYGVCEASGDGAINTAESNAWWAYLDKNNISYCNWAISDKAESASALPGGASGNGGWPANTLTTSGTLVRNYYKSKCNSVVVVVTPPANYKIHKTVNPITIDGTIDDNWNNAQVLAQPITNILQAGITNAADLSGTFKALWDNNYLYVLGEIKDDVLNQDSPNAWDDDCVEIYIDINNDKAGTYAANDVEYNFEYNNNGAVTANPGTRPITNVNYVMLPKTGGYIFETRIPWTTILGSPVVGQLVGFDFHVNDDDDGGVRDSKLAWTATTDDAWQFTSSFGTAVLEDALSILSNTEEMGTNKLNVFPNPAINSVTIQQQNLRFNAAILLDVCGNTLQNLRLNQLSETLSLDNLAQGIYILKLSGELEKTVKIVVQ